MRGKRSLLHEGAVSTRAFCLSAAHYVMDGRVFSRREKESEGSSER